MKKQPPKTVSKLKHLREQAGLSQTALAQASGISQARLSAWESGGRKIENASIKVLANLRTPLKCTLDDLLPAG